MTNDVKEMPLTATPIIDRVHAIGGELAESFCSLLDELPGEPSAAREIGQVLNVDKVLIHKLLRSVRSVDPLATVHTIPGPVPLKRVIKAARSKGVSEPKIKAAEKAVASFQRLVTNEVGDRSGLDAIISTRLPDARGTFEGLAKQWVYRGIRQIKGISADVTFTTIMLTPAETGRRCNVATLRGFLGLRCIRPGAEMTVGVISRVFRGEPEILTLDGEPIQNARQILLEDYCSLQPANVQVHDKQSSVVFTLEWGGLAGLRSTCDLVTAQLRRNSMRRWHMPEDKSTKTGLLDGISVPTQTYIFDILLDEGVYPDWQPQVRILELGEFGLADVEDRTRDLDVLDLEVEVKSMGIGIERFRAREIPSYCDMLNHAAHKIGAAPKRLRGYRTLIDYPVFGTQLQYAFELPNGEPT